MKRVSVLYLGLPNTQLFEFFTTLNDFPKLCTSFAGGHAFEWDDDDLLRIGLGFESKCYFGWTMQWRLPSIMNRKMNSLRLWLRGLDLDIYKIKVTVCVCLFSIEIQTAGRIGTKFGTEVVLEGGRFLGGFDPVPPPPGYGVRKGGAGCLWSLNRAFWQKLY